MGDFRRHRGASPRQQEAFGGKGGSSLASRRALKDWDAGNRDASVSRTSQFSRRNRPGWDAGSARTNTPPAADRRQDGAESDDDIAAKPRAPSNAGASMAGSMGASRAPAHAPPPSHTGSGASYYNTAAVAPPPDLVQTAYEADDVASVPPKKASALYPTRHHQQEKSVSQIDVGLSRRVRLPAVETASPPPLAQHRPATAAVAPAPPTTTASPVVDTQTEYPSKSANGTALEMSSSVARLSKTITAMQSSFQAQVKDVEAVKSTTMSHASLIAALQQSISGLVDQTKSLGGQVMQLETSHGKRLSHVEVAQEQLKAQLRSHPAVTADVPATEIQTEAPEAVGDTHLQGPQAHAHIKVEGDGKSTAAATAGERTADDSRAGAVAAAPNAAVDMTPTSPTLRPPSDAHPGDIKPRLRGQTASMNGTAVPDPAARAAAAPAPPIATAATLSDSIASASFVRLIRNFQTKLLDVEQKCSQLSASQEGANAAAAAAAPATDAEVLEAARGVLKEAQATLAQQRDAQGSYEKRMRRFVGDVERMVKALQEQLMGVDHYIQMQTARVDTIAHDCREHRERLGKLETARVDLEQQQVTTKQSTAKLSESLEKMQEKHQTLVAQVQRAEAERQREARRAKEAAAAKAAAEQRAAAAAAAQQAEEQQKRDREAAEARVRDAETVKALQQENADLEARLAVLERLLSKDGLKELVQSAIATTGKAGAGGATPKAGGKAGGRVAGRASKATTPAASVANSGSSESQSQDPAEASDEEEEEVLPKKTKRKAPTKRKRTNDTDATEGQEGSSAEKKAKTGKKTRQGTRGSK
eukprot:jgi/Ulvmu1/8758/UM048_0012.1